MLREVDGPLTFLWLQSPYTAYRTRARRSAAAVWLTRTCWLWLDRPSSQNPVVVAVLLFLGGSVTGLARMPPLDQAVGGRLTPLILINVVGLSLNTLCLNYVQASFYQVGRVSREGPPRRPALTGGRGTAAAAAFDGQVARALILPFTVVLARLALNTHYTAQVLGACAVVFVGFVVGVWGEVEPSALGIVFGVASSVTTALHAIVIKRSLAVVGDQTLVLAYFNNVLSMVYLLPVVVLAEFPALARALTGNVSATFVYGTLVAVRTERMAAYGSATSQTLTTPSLFPPSRTPSARASLAT